MGRTCCGPMGCTAPTRANAWGVVPKRKAGAAQGRSSPTAERHRLRGTRPEAVPRRAAERPEDKKAPGAGAKIGGHRPP